MKKSDWGKIKLVFQKLSHTHLFEHYSYEDVSKGGNSVEKIS
ncbi:hypothetical protein DF16_pBMB95orf00104 (plasmid) [Bacillus thuringiensis serovar kurstaki str. YBT-1520]|uniref:Uncharacterized protein n=1 Tax=Bacillus thuringiensis serovar chinensis CT-43 TaxID=541229 RepID=E7CGD1_BACTU|nr:hypothetical protein pBMB0558_00010 [Bacillus thuringiensis serovar chinensis CT-43]AEA19229.1 hypothetical protein CT43_P127047 [Bacillus thuringiensis serovar chinensis CT-43]AGE81566.1 hypothetical protein HD73_7010 [Bacillus thuringiensis serovar kurstaki str. HD73]AGG04758.1 hypothetical protein H175_107p034 [Bacillus thuringiensis serovar thuringiensis str. IS5056]AIM34517.1 hypothetical protein DF16_pBMB95orf00104 [Bacillus thuringiensis serovar kurstaki str. YBT-1520]